MSLDFYRAFEDRHRGSRELIQDRQRAYLPFLRELVALYPGATVTDVGCGRGEWLEMLRAQGIAARGVDLDEGMLSACRELGLDVRRGDAVAFLQSQEADSQLAVSGFHIAEHLPFDTLHALVAQALRVLKPGGLLILETPNPENLVVGTSSFYLDPTHQRPLPWQLLEFLAQYHGFGRIKVMRMQESAALAERESLSLMDVLGGASPDYAVVAQKPPRAEDESRLAAAFLPDYGLSLETLAARYDTKLKEDVYIASVNALQAERQSRQAREFQQVADHQFHQIQLRLADNERYAREAYAASVHTHNALVAVHNSASWRVTAPLRSGKAWLRRAAGTAVAAASRIASAVGIHGPLRALYRKLRPEPQATAPVAAADPPQEDVPRLPPSPSQRRIDEQLEAQGRPRPGAGD
ncbi:MAG: methyltransferase domain-containing protein [Ramlibacter sp.]